MEAHPIPARRADSRADRGFAASEPVSGGPRWRGWLGSPLAVWTAVCVALAAISAATLPTVPSYDPWSWVVWGREVVDPHLSFAVGGGPSWKPLPVVFTTVFGLFGGAAPTLWVLAARAGGLLALPAAYRLAARLVPGPSLGQVVAGVLAAAGILLTQDWFYYMYRGTSEPLLIATWLWAIDRHLDGRHATSFGLVVATSLMRPEAWPFLGVYAVWLWRRQPTLSWRALIFAGLALVPLGWFLPPWIGGGHPFLAASHAHEYNGHLGHHPLVTVLHRGVDIQILPALIGAAAALALAAWRLRSARSGVADRLGMAFAALIVTWWVIVVGMTLVGYPGLERFYLPAAALICVLAGAGLVALAELVRSPGWARPALLGIAIGASVPLALSRASGLPTQTRLAARAVRRLDQLSAAVGAVGGHRGVYPCRSSFASVNHSVQTALAFKLHVTLGRVGTAMRHQGVLFLGPHDSIDGGPPAVNHRLTQRRLVVRVGAWRVYRVTAPGASARCVGGGALTS